MSRVDAWGIEHSYLDGGGERRQTTVEIRQKLSDAMQTGGREQPAEPGVLFVEPGDSVAISRPADLTLEDGTELHIHASLPPDLPLGYHTLRDAASGNQRRVIVAPKRCFQRAGPPIWGWALQLYSLRSRNSWGMGDLADLRSFTRWAADELGAGVVMTNPLNAAAPGVPQQPSPYSPTSRTYRNLLYIRIEDVPGAGDIADLEQLTRRASLLNELPAIDRDAIYRLKIEALEKIWNSARDRIDFSAFEREQGRQLDQFALYCVFREWHGPDWRSWPEKLRRPEHAALSAEADGAQDRLRFHKWIQYLLEQQLSKVSTEPLIMQDLPIGVDPDGSDAWAWQDLFAQGVSVGAPPDQFNTQGQDWGLQPFIPHKLRAANYEPFIQIIRTAMRHSAALRIDHVMGLFRLFWIPAGIEKQNGAYVHYRPDEMLSLVALESIRAKAFVVGEDLGTVENSVRETLLSRGVLSYRLMWFEERDPPYYPEKALAAITTHDLPTVAGLWSGADLREQQKLGLKPNVKGTKESRELLKRITRADDGTPIDEVIERAHSALAQAPSTVIIGSMEDALGMETRPNLPGTLTDQRPNWSIPLPKKFESIKQDPLVRKVAVAMRNGR